jgi:hypothetical protein
VDAADPGKFNIECVVAGERGVIEGTLLDDDVVRMSARSGTALEARWKVTDAIKSNPWVR